MGQVRTSTRLHSLKNRRARELGNLSQISVTDLSEKDTTTTKNKMPRGTFPHRQGQPRPLPV